MDRQKLKDKFRGRQVNELIGSSLLGSSFRANIVPALTQTRRLFFVS